MGTSFDYEGARATIASAIPFNAHIGLGVAALGPGTAEVVLPDRSELKNHIGSQHASGLFAAAEAASGAAVIGALGASFAEVRLLVRGATVRYVKVARGAIHAKARLDATGEELLARVRRDGRTAAKVEVTLVDEAGQGVAEVAIDWDLRIDTGG